MKACDCKLSIVEDENYQDVAQVVYCSTHKYLNFAAPDLLEAAKRVYKSYLWNKETILSFQGAQIATFQGAILDLEKAIAKAEEKK